MVTKYPSKVCNKAVAKSHNAIQCGLCDMWVHVKCKKINLQTYRFLQQCRAQWFCCKCLQNTMPFGDLTDHELFQTLQGKKIKFTAVTQSSIKPYKNLINDLNSSIDNTDQIASFHYYNINELNNVTRKYKSKKHEIMFFFHMNISSLPFHFDELYAFLSELNYSPDIIAISEPCLKFSTQPIAQINLGNYCVEHKPTESSNGGTLLYIKNNISYKLRNDLKIYKTKELESIFIEIINKTSINTIVGCIY